MDVGTLHPCSSNQTFRYAGIPKGYKRFPKRLLHTGVADLQIGAAVKCSIENCERTVIARGMCGAHYQQWRFRNPSLVGNLYASDLSDLDLTNRCHRHRARQLGFDVPKLKAGGGVKPFDSFFTKLGIESCWIWRGGKDPEGYGNYHPGESRTVKAHRHSWMLANGPIPDGLNVLHSCDNPPCVNPNHLFLGTDADNVADKVRKGRQAVGERTAKVKLTAEQVRDIRSVMGKTSGRALSKIYGVNPSSIHAIWKRESWKHI